MERVKVEPGAIAPIGLTGERITEEQLVRLKEAVNATENPVVYLGIDPGESNGVCGYDAKFYPLFMWTIHHEDMVMFLHQFENVKTCVCEGYMVFPNKARQHIYSDLKTPRVIGRIESWAETHRVELVKQPSHIKATGYKWVGVKPLAKSNKKNHSLDAHIHFMYWCVMFGHIKLEDLIKRDHKG